MNTWIMSVDTGEWRLLTESLVIHRTHYLNGKVVERAIRSDGTMAWSKEVN